MSKILPFGNWPRLFNVDSISSEVPDADGQPVNLRWWVDRDTPPVAYAAAIQNYNPADEYAVYVQGYICELFTHAEAVQLKAHLESAGLPDTTITEVTLPIDGLIMGVSYLPIGGPQRNYDLPEAENFSLPLTIYGYVDLRTVWGNPEPDDDEDVVLL